MTQLTLFSDTIQARFAAYDAEHPEVFRLFRELAEKVRSRGFCRYSADAIIQQIRWWHVIERGDADFKINDHFSSRYARKLIAADPSFDGFFELRRLEAA